MFVYKPSGNTLTPFLRITISKMVDVRFVPQCSIHKKERIKISFSLLAIISLIKLGYSSKVRFTRLREIEDSFLYEKYRFNFLTDKFDDLFSSEGEQRFMKDQDQIISRDIIRVIWR